MTARTTRTTRSPLRDARPAAPSRARAVAPDRPTSARSSRFDDPALAAEVDRLLRRGVAPEIVAAEHGLDPKRLARLALGHRARRLVEAPIDYVAHGPFDDPAERPAILGPMPDAEAAGRRRRAPEGLPPYLASLYDTPLLTRQQEAHLFRKMNFLKHRAEALRTQINPDRPSAPRLDELEDLLDQALAVKNQLIRANLRLVVSIAKRHVGPSKGFFELVSDGNVALMRAVEKFDFARGFKFSTYASWAVLNAFARGIPAEAQRRDRFVTGHEAVFESTADHRDLPQSVDSERDRMLQAVQGLLGRLDDRERRILVSRYGLGGAAELTLEQLGRELGITKERVRQLESRAERKLRTFAAEGSFSTSDVN